MKVLVVIPDAYGAQSYNRIILFQSLSQTCNSYGSPHTKFIPLSAKSGMNPAEHTLDKSLFSAWTGRHLNVEKPLHGLSHRVTPLGRCLDDGTGENPTHQSSLEAELYGQDTPHKYGLAMTRSTESAAPGKDAVKCKHETEANQNPTGTTLTQGFLKNGLCCTRTNTTEKLQFPSNAG